MKMSCRFILSVFLCCCFLPLNNSQAGAQISKTSKEASAQSQKYYEQSMALKRPDQRRQAMSAIDLALKADPGNAKAQLRKGMLLWWSDRPKEANEILAKALKQSPECKDWMVYDALGASYYMEGRKQEALATYNAGIKNLPKASNIFFNRASIRQDWKQYDLALADFSQAIECDPKKIYLWKARGYLYKQLGQNKKALADLSQAIQLSPNETELYQMRAKVFQAMGNSAAAQHDTQKAKNLVNDEM
jgi:tetratricopeptide (TPR) repeat protein